MPFSVPRKGFRIKEGKRCYRINTLRLNDESKSFLNSYKLGLVRNNILVRLRLVSNFLSLCTCLS